MSGSPSPLVVVFRGPHPPYQGQARVISDPPGIDCPGVCSFQFRAQTVLLNGYADKDSAILGSILVPVAARQSLSRQETIRCVTLRNSAIVAQASSLMSIHTRPRDDERGLS
jgi:hypothetical protein